MSAELTADDVAGLVEGSTASAEGEKQGYADYMANQGETERSKVPGAVKNREGMSYADYMSKKEEVRLAKVASAVAHCV